MERKIEEKQGRIELKKGIEITITELERICLELEFEKFMESNGITIYEDTINLYFISEKDGKYKIEQIYRK